MRNNYYLFLTQSSEHNTIARIFNVSSRRLTDSIAPFVDAHNQLIPNFPATIHSIDALDGKLKLNVLSRYIANYSSGHNIDVLLQALEQVPAGDLASRITQSDMTIGIQLQQLH